MHTHSFFAVIYTIDDERGSSRGSDRQNHVLDTALARV